MIDVLIAALVFAVFYTVTSVIKWTILFGYRERRMRTRSRVVVDLPDMKIDGWKLTKPVLSVQDDGTLYVQGKGGVIHRVRLD